MCHADGAGGADEPAEMATNAFLTDDTGLAVVSERNRLVTTIHTGYIAASAADTLLTVDLGEDHRIAVEIRRQHDILQLFAHEFLELRNTPLGHIMLQAEAEVVDDAVAVLHDGGAYLDVTATELDELQRVAPGLDTTYTADIHMLLDTGTADHGVTRHLVDHAQGDRLDGLARVAGDSLALTHLGLVAHRNRLDGIDGADTMGAGIEASQGGTTHRHDIGRHLGDDGDRDRLLDARGVAEDQIVALTDIRTQTRELHLRAGEIELHGIAAGLLGHLGEFDPLLLALPHDRGDDALGGVAELEATQDIEVHVVGILGELLHIAETDKGRTLFAYGVEAGRYLADVLLADGLVEHTGPSGLQGTGYHLVVGADSRRGQEERILADHVAEVDFQAWQVRSTRSILINRSIQNRLLQLRNADGAIVMDTSGFGLGYLVVGETGKEFGSRPGIVETEGANSAGGASTAGGIVAKQAASSFFG